MACLRFPPGWKFCPGHESFPREEFLSVLFLAIPALSRFRARALRLAFDGRRCRDRGLQRVLELFSSLRNHFFEILPVHSVGDFQFAPAQDIPDIDYQFVRIKGF